MLITDNSLKDLGIPVPHNIVLKKALFSYLKVNKINSLLGSSGMDEKGLKFVDSLFDRLNIAYTINDNDLRNIPISGPFIAIANHPFGFLDGLILMHIIGQKHPSFKVLANFFLKQFEPLKDFFIDLDPFDTNHTLNFKGLRKAYQRLEEGSPIGIFPAGEVATMQKGLRQIVDKSWNSSIIKFIINAGVTVVPIYFEGANSLKFHLLGKIHPYLRTLTIPSEFFKQENKAINVRIGKPVLASTLKDFDNVQKAGRYLRATLYGLGSKVDVGRHFKFSNRRKKEQEPVIEAVSREVINVELEYLKNHGGLLFSQSNYEIYLSKAQNLPNIINELGRLRELTFRSVGEGTGNKLDVDEYDLYYQHLFIWDNRNQSIVGAYRLGQGDMILNTYGFKGFYVTSLFELKEGLKPILSQTLELGRSFVVQEYQQKPLPLFLLWQGILRFLLKNKQYKYLLGPVSISNDFTPYSKDLLIAFIKKYHFNHELASLVQPKNEFVVKTDIDDIEVVLEKHANDLKELDKYISGIEPGYLKIPVLLKQYVKQNAKIIGFNVDLNFNDCLDGLILLDLEDLPQTTFDFLNN